jgi:hypothetical protein
MTAADLIDVLAHPPFEHGSTQCLLSVDRGVRDFLIAALAARRGKA